MPQSEASLHAIGDSIFCVHSSVVKPHSFVAKFRQHTTGQVKLPHGISLPGSPPVLEDAAPEAATVGPTATDEATLLDAVAPPAPLLLTATLDEASPLLVSRSEESLPHATSPDTTRATPSHT
jgi:hypothetical protein